MTETQIKQIEKTFNCRLPAIYKRLLTVMPKPLKHLMSLERPGHRAIFTDKDLIIKTNKSLRNAESLSWPEKYFIIGGDCGGNLLCLNLVSKRSCVYFWWHETDEFFLHAKDIPAFIRRIYRMEADGVIDWLELSTL